MVLASGRIGRPGCGYATITGQGNGQGGREHGQKCDQLPGGRDIANPEHRAHVAEVWGIDPDELPGPASMPTRSSARSIAARSRACSSSASIPRCRCRTARSSAGCSTNWSFTSPSTSSSTKPPITPTSCCRDRCTRKTRAPSRRSKAASSRSTMRRSARRRAPGLAHHSGHRAGAGPQQGLHLRQSARNLRRTARASAGGVADYAGITYESIEQEYGVFWPCPVGGPPRNAAPVRGGLVEPDRPRAGPLLLPRRQGTLQRRRLHAASRRRRCGVSDYPDDRPRRQPVSVRHADAPHRAAGRSVSRAAHRDASALGEPSWASATATGRRSNRAAARARCGRRW